MKNEKFFMIAPDAMAALVFCLVQAATPAHAQMAKEPWGFAPQNRASIAALMQQVEDKSASASTQTASSGDVLICGGGGGSSTATGNASCIILNNSDALLNIGQDSHGDQGSQNTVKDTNTSSPADDVLATLGDK